MPTNFYFDTGTTSEKRLYEDLVIEQLKVFGQDVYYMPRTLVAEDTILGEDTLSKFDDAYMIEMYFENTDGFAGDKEIMNQFGLENREEATFVVSQRRFEDMISVDDNLQVKTRPNEGDLIYFPLVSKVFEISFVDHDEPFYQIGNLPVYKLSVKTFEYSSEDLDTGITEIDAIETAYTLDALGFQISLEQNVYNESFRLEDGTGFVGIFESGSLTEYTATSSNKVIGEDETLNGALIAENLADTGEPMYIIQEEYVVGDMVRDKTAQNELFDKLDDTILDFSESNPFGDAGTKG
tara:strand:- start:994 stop:1878 length:885 start_codon:yes stop_codon:yes gene_type:complete